MVTDLARLQASSLSFGANHTSALCGPSDHSCYSVAEDPIDIDFSPTLNRPQPPPSSPLRAVQVPRCQCFRNFMSQRKSLSKYLWPGGGTGLRTAHRVLGTKTLSTTVPRCPRLRLTNGLLDPLSPYLSIYVMMPFRRNVL